MRRFIAIAALALCVSWFCEPICAVAATNLLKNDDLAAGFDGAPADWYALTSDRKLSRFSWTYTPGEGGVLGISNQGRTFAGWHQALILRPGIYEVSAEVRVQGAMPHEGGANLAITTYDGLELVSNHLNGTTDWQTLSFFLIEDRWGDTTELACSLGELRHPDIGRAAFRNIKVIALGKVSAPGVAPPPGMLTLDLSPILEQYKGRISEMDTLALIRRPSLVRGPPSDSSAWVRAAGVVSGLILLGLLGWAMAEIWRPALRAGQGAWMLAVCLSLAITAVKFIALFHFTGFYWDIFAKSNRALLAVALGPSKIYDPGLPVDSYPPASLYLLWLSGWIGGLIEPAADGFRVIVETPPLIAGLLIGLTLYCAAWREGRSSRALIVMMLFALNPALLFDSVVWGQSDTIVALPMIAAAILILAGRYRLGWTAVAIAILAKPQALALVPPLGLWTLFNAGLAECGWCAGALIATIAIGIIPYQIGHPWDWTFNVYKDLGTRFSEASVGAFNFMGLIGGIGTPDTDAVLAGVSYRALGLLLTCAVYLVASYMIWRARSARAAMLAIFVALFGFFMFAPRMHERYLYYPLVFLVPIALDSGFLTAIFAAVSATFLFNLSYIKHLADTSSYFPSHPNAALIATASINLAAFFAVTAYGLTRTSPPGGYGDDAAQAAPPAITGIGGDDAPPGVAVRR